MHIKFRPSKNKAATKQDEYITIITDKCKSMKNDMIPYYLDEHGIIEKSEMNQIFSTQLWSLMLCNHMIYMKAIMD